MGLFKKKKKEEKKVNEVPSLPELPKLPELPESNFSKSIHQLPSFPNDSLGEKFSQDTIKEAITGKKEDENVSEAEDKEENPMFQRHSEIQKFSREIPKAFTMAARKVKEAEPIFIRIDKFEESLEVFEKIKEQISEIEKMLKEIKQIREDEEEELRSWEEEIKNSKDQIGKIDKDLFSKIQ